MNIVRSIVNIGAEAVQLLRASWNSPMVIVLCILGACCLETHAVTGEEGRVVARRLNRLEYQNTIRDLLGVQLDFQELLPLDNSAGGFDNVAEALHMSPFLLERYLEAAGLALDRAIANRPQPPLIRKRYSLKDSHQVRATTERVFRRSETDDRLVLFSSSRWQAVTLSPFYPPDPGRYRFRIAASAVQSSGMPVTWQVDAGLMLMTGKQHLVGYFDAIPDEVGVVEFVEELDARNTIRILPYGLASSQEVHKVGSDEYAGPGLAIDWVEVEGPLHDSWPPRSHRLIFGELQQQSAPRFDQRDRLEVVAERPEAEAETVLRRFCRSAFRRAVSDAEIRPFVELVKNRLADGRSFEQAMRVGLTAVLVSPQFLFLHEAPGRLDDFALASRLSYFLWSSMPDEALLREADSGNLHQPEVLHAQIERMLKDKKAEFFVRNFVGQWLNLREIDATMPSHLMYPEFDDMLKASMVREAELFFAELLEHDLSLTNFIASDFSMLNGRLAKHYGIPGINGWQFRRVTLPDDSHRGGVLTMAGVLKVTANGTYTSPVSRGVWILERILGTPPAPPPEAVPGLVPDTRGATTIREQLIQHRSHAACSGCHIEIDPPGFALESFDVIGGYRERYRLSNWSREAKEVVIDGRKMRYYEGASIDPSDVLLDGRAFKNSDELKELLLAEPARVARCLASKLVTYATGAAPTDEDELSIEGIVDQAKESNYGLRSLIHAIAHSDLFQRK